MNAIRYNVETVLFILLILLSGISPTMNAMIAPVTYSVRGKVIDRQSRQPVAYANVFVAGIPGKGASTDSLGTFKIEQVPPGIYSLEASCIGYQTVSTPEYIVSASTPFIEIEMEEDANLLNTVVVVPSPFRRSIESPVSMRIIGLQEIEKSPGANRDVSRIVRSYPGVSFSPIGYRNDLIVRGGSPSENRFYMDGIEIPNINHFATQGASGGPVSIVNADLIREITFYTGAFPANRSGALSSVLDFRLKDGNPDKQAFKATIGASEVSLSGAGHLGQRTTYLFSARQSYLQLLFKALGLPFLSGSTGLYHQSPPYTALGYKDNEGQYLNKGLKYMQVFESSLGLDWHLQDRLMVSAEGFFKRYSRMPLSLQDNIPLACKGNDYGVTGNETLVPTASGRAYGLETMFRWQASGKFNLVSSFTLYRSEYRNRPDGDFIPSAWDNRFILNMSGTYNLSQRWSIGGKLSYIGGSPYTPYDEDKSSLVEAWDAKGQPYYDYAYYNTGRLPKFAQLDLRVDKSFYFHHCMIGIYLDIQNITGNKLKQPDVIMSTGIIENPSAPVAEQRYKMKYLKQESGTILPTLGITVEF